MFDVVWQRLDHGARLSLPFATTFLCTLLSVIVWPIPHMGAVAPPLAIIAIYYWALHRPDLLGPGAAFIIGLLFDIINFLPLGLSALLFVAAHHLILRSRRFFTGHSFYMMWLGFGLTTFAIMLSEWFALCMIRWQSVPLFPVLMQSIMAIVIFPLPCWLFIRLQRSTFGQN